MNKNNKVHTQLKLKNLSERSISETFQKNINDDNDARGGELEPLENDKQSILDDFERRIDNLKTLKKMHVVFL